MTIIGKCLFGRRCEETTCSYNSIWILLALRTVFWNYLFKWWYSIYWIPSSFKTPPSKKIVPKYRLSNRLFRNTVIQTSSFQIPSFKELVDKYCHSNKYFPNTVPTFNLQISSLKEVVSKIPSLEQLVQKYNHSNK